MIKTIRACVALVLLSCTAFAQAPSTEAERVEAYVRAEMANRGLPGVSVAVARRGTMIMQGAYGVASVELGVPATVETVYPLASATKPFTGACVMMLVEEGKLRLDDTLRQLLPGLPENWGGVTVRQLLSHTSGLPDVAVQTGKIDLIAQTREEALEKLPKLPLEGPPGEKWRYNQTNYMLLKMIVEKLTGRQFEDVARERLFTPLGLTATAFGDSGDLVPGRASLYTRGDDGPKPRQLLFPGYLRTAAGINSNVLELVRWADAVAKGRLVSSESRDQMWKAVSPLRADKPGTVGYGLGWVVDDRPSHRSAGHSGGGTAAFRVYVDDGVTIAILTNGITNPDDLLEGVARIYIPALGE